MLVLTVVQTAGRAACGLDFVDNEVNFGNVNANTLFQSVEVSDVTTGDCTLE